MVTPLNGGASLPGQVDSALAQVKKTVQKNAPASEKFSTTENELADQVSLSSDNTRYLEGLKNLDTQLTRYLDAAKGNRSIDAVLGELNREQGGGKQVATAAYATTDLNISQTTQTTEITSLAAEVNEEGELDLILNQTRETLTQTNVTLASHQGFFEAAVG